MKMKKKRMIWWVGVLVLIGLAIGGTALVAGDKDHDDRQAVEKTIVIRSGTDSGAYLGVVMSQTRENETDSGVVVRSVMDDSPAKKAGIEDGDVIVRIDGKDVEGMQEITSVIKEMKPGDDLKLTVKRGKDRLNLTATLEDRSDRNEFRYEFRSDEDAPFVFSFGDDDGDHLGEWVEKFSEDFGNQEKLQELQEHLEEMKQHLKEQSWRNMMEDRLVVPFGGPKLGVELVRTTPELREHLGGDRDAGVLVGRVMKGSAAEKAGVQVGDLIVAANGESVAGTTDLLREIHGNEGEELDLEVIRDRHSMHLTAVIPEADAPVPMVPHEEASVASKADSSHGRKLESVEEKMF